MSEATAPAVVNRTAVMQLTADDIAQANFQLFRSNFRNRKTMTRLLILWLVFMLLMIGWTASYGVDDNFLSEVIAYALIGLAAAFGFPTLVVVALTKPQARQRFQQQKTLQAPITLGWDEENYRSETQYGTARLPWRNFHRVLENDRAMLLFEGGGLYRIVLKRALTPEQVQDLHACIRQGNPDLFG